MCEALLLTIFLQVRIMSSTEENASKDVEAHRAFTMQAMHQQFEGFTSASENSWLENERIKE